MSRIGPYRLLRLIKRGGQGRVFLGFDERLQRQVAIKLYPQPERRAARRQLLREARLVAALDSPRLVKIFDVVVTRENLALIMEYVPGCDLEELLTVVQISQSSALQIAADVSAALAASRQAGIVHGDVKAANMLVTREGRVKLTDFGIADNAGDASMGAGSASAMSPEQCLRECLDVRTDLFALGCLLYRMLIGEHPFFTDGQFNIDRLLALERPQLAEMGIDGSPISDELRRLVHRLLQKEPNKRPENTHEVRRVIRGVRRSLPLHLGNTLAVEARPWFRREDVIPQQESEERRTTYQPPPPGLLSLECWRQITVRHPVRLTAGLAVTGLCIGMMAWTWFSPQTVHFLGSNVAMGPQAGRAGTIDIGWVRAELMTVAKQALGRVRFTGDGVAAMTHFSTAPPPDLVAQADERLGIDMRCNASVCLLEFSRVRAGKEWRQQAMLLAGDGERQWQDAVQSSARALYTK
ncbi:MAG: serine/threonine-protein kinase [Halioglobus sp.]